ncbi:Nuclear pore complex protein NUP214 [Zea mays]|uniref:Nuclear pore complex protein NUP214 n=1 Tax=Zea mays TaxID=4577 RepID=A0A1D6MW13_MAIZE|nr:Nuclear pore complex protein NUP214 [Zea mays]
MQGITARDCGSRGQVFKSKVEEQCSKIEYLRNNMFQGEIFDKYFMSFLPLFVMQTYMKGIVSQSSDNQYWDIWNRQKLSPEFEVKRQNSLRANQDLTNQLVELERHFNNLEMNRSGETGRVASNRRVVYSNKSSSRYLTVRPSCYKFYTDLVIIISLLTNN